MKKRKNWVYPLTIPMHKNGKLVRVRWIDVPVDVREAIEAAERENERLRNDPAAQLARAEAKQGYIVEAIQRRRKR